LHFSSSDTVISYLPLAHIFEMCVELSSLASCCRIGYASPMTLVDGAPKLTAGCPGDARMLQPTFMPAVPAILDRIHRAVMDKLAAKPPAVQSLLKMAFDRKAKRFAVGKPCKILDK
jgi:long-chain acyl-CoA synthetase